MRSLAVVTDENNSVLERHSFDTWGKRRFSDWTPAGAGQVPASQWTTRGYTDHVMLEDVGLVHMKGRVYDPELARFTSADSYIQNATVPGMLNRYSYVLNRPLSATDPSDHFIEALIGVIAGLLAGSAGLTAGGAIGTSIATALAISDCFLINVIVGVSSVVVAGAAAGFAGSFASTLVAGGNLGQAFSSGLTSAMWGGITAAAAFGVGHLLAPAIAGASGELATELAADVGHALVGGALAEARGEDFWIGAVSSGAGALSGSTSQLWLRGNEGVFLFASRTALAAIAGGTAAEASGGKFANGAMTATFQHLFNDELGWFKRAMLKVTGGPVKNDIKEKLYGQYSDFNNAGEKYGVSPRLIYSTIVMESRGWGYLGGTDFALRVVEGGKSWVGTWFGKAGSYGWGQLGPQARQIAGMTVEDTFDLRKSIVGVAKFYQSGIAQFVLRDIPSPTPAQLGTWYNSGQIGPVSDYGVQLQHIYNYSPNSIKF